jgi:hypothetical protein
MRGAFLLKNTTSNKTASEYEFQASAIVERSHTQGTSVTPYFTLQSNKVGLKKRGANTSTNTNGGNTNSANTNADGYAGKDDLPLQIQNPIGAETAPELISRAIQILLGLIAMIAVVVIIVAGIRMVTAGGNPDQIKTAKSAIMWAIVGLVVALMSFSIVAIVERLIK